MSAVLASASAQFTFNGAAVSLSASSATELLEALAKFGLVPAANDAAPAAPKPAAAKAEVKAEPAKKPEAASTPSAAPASAPAAASGSAAADDAPRPTYDDVKARVLALAKISRETATAALGKFGVDHGNKLKLEQYSEFLAHADALIEAAKS